ncbi:chromosomal replication initiator protein DnaA [Fontivita pretiosa]|uniref:chromosomal replication initiator protein DnaA n=1 Tax=Fontivita pretiosa TaxID=2989684 RepID=UPI003D173A83
MSCISAHDPQLARLADAIAQRVGQQRFHVWFNNSTKLDLKQDGLEIAVPNDFISEWIGTHFTRSIQEAAHEVLGCSLPVRFNVVPQLFETGDADDSAATNGAGSARVNGNGSNGGHNGAAASNGRSGSRGARGVNGQAATHPQRQIGPASQAVAILRPNPPAGTLRTSPSTGGAAFANRPRLRHDMDSFVVGPSNQLAYNAANYVAEFPGGQYNPLFIHGCCGLGKTHLLQGLCRRFIEHHPTKRWMYLTGEEFTNEFLMALRGNRIDSFRRKVRDLDLLVIDDVHFLGGKKATQEEFLHTFNAIEAMGRQVVMASDNHPKMIEEFGESLINRFVSGMVVRIDPPNYATRCEILRAMSQRDRLNLPEDVINWIARRVTQNVRELEGAITRIAAHVQLTGRQPDLTLTVEALGDLDRHLVAPVKPENVLQSVCNYFGLEHKDLMSGRRQRTISLARSVAMYLVRKTAKLSFPEIGMRMGKRNHSTVISACRRIERAVARNEPLSWSSAIGHREEEASELIQRLEEHARAMS